MAEQRTIVAVHEAGHCVIAELLGCRVIYAELAGGGGCYRYRPIGDRHADVREAAIAFAGPIAQDHFAPTSSPAVLRGKWRGEWRVDLENARRALAAYGADERCLIGRVRHTVRRHWPAILRMAAALHERGRLTGAEIAMLME